MREKAFAAVKTAIEQLNEELDYDNLRNVTNDTAIYGGEEGFDSLSLMFLVATLEEEIKNCFGKQITLTNETGMWLSNNHFRTAGSLADFIVSLLGTRQG